MKMSQAVLAMAAAFGTQPPISRPLPTPEGAVMHINELFQRVLGRVRRCPLSMSGCG